MTTVTTPRSDLTTGWEPEGPTDDTLLRRFVFAYADRIERMALRSGRRVEGSSDARSADLGSPFRFDNAVVLLRPLSDLDSVVARARSFFTTPWVLLSAWPTPDLSGLGLRLVGHPPLMFRPPAPWPSSPPELRVVEVDGAKALGDFERTLVTGYPLPEASAVFDPGLVGEVLRLFVGYVAGEPVSVAGAAVNHGIVEVDWVATLPHARGRGYGAALTMAAAGIAPGLPALLLASDAGRPVYQHLGFIDLLRTTMWEGQP
jgi:GNAT superfamily N-acetyltransferase